MVPCSLKEPDSHMWTGCIPNCTELLLAAHLQVLKYMYIGASLVAQTVKNLPVMWETRIDPWIRKIPCRNAWQPTPGFLPGESDGQRSLAGSYINI